MKNYSRADLVIRNRRIMLAIAVLFTVIMGFVFFTSRASAINSREVYTYYTSYEIKSGDTLWTIADEFMGPDFQNKKEFISNIKRINHLSDDNITAGKYLVIEYSSYEKL